jgi:hypothetical protein
MTKQRTPRATGRPREYADRVRFTIVLEHDELRAITAAAGDEPVASWLRRAALAQLRKGRKGTKA